MSPSRWALSVWLVCHVVAMLLVALPDADTLPSVQAVRHPQDDAVAARLTPMLDRLAQTAVAVLRFVKKVAGPVRPLALSYLRTIGQTQNWSMFWDPPKTDLYVRVRYYVASPGDRSRWTATELVYPTMREDRVRFTGYRVQHRDKAVFSMLISFEAHSKAGGGTRPVPDDLAPVARYFARGFAQRALAPGERIVRTEVWSASVANPPRGQQLDPAVAAARLARLAAYYDGAAEQRGVPALPTARLAVEREVDLLWVLHYIDEP